MPFTLDSSVMKTLVPSHSLAGGLYVCLFLLFAFRMSFPFNEVSNHNDAKMFLLKKKN